MQGEGTKIYSFKLPLHLTPPDFRDFFLGLSISLQNIAKFTAWHASTLARFFQDLKFESLSPSRCLLRRIFQIGAWRCPSFEREKTKSTEAFSPVFTTVFGSFFLFVIMNPDFQHLYSIYRALMYKRLQLRYLQRSIEMAADLTSFSSNQKCLRYSNPASAGIHTARPASIIWIHKILVAIITYHSLTYEQVCSRFTSH